MLDENGDHGLGVFVGTGCGFNQAQREYAELDPFVAELSGQFAMMADGRADRARGRLGTGPVLPRHPGNAAAAAGWADAAVGGGADRASRDGAPLAGGRSAPPSDRSPGEEWDRTPLNPGNYMIADSQLNRSLYSLVIGHLFHPLSGQC